MSFHYDKHHAGYVKRLNAALEALSGEAAGMANLSLQELIIKTRLEENFGLFNNAAQAWNHAFYWDSMSPDGGGEPSGELAQALESSFGSVDAWREKFISGANQNFASGWGWLVRHPGEDRLVVVQTNDAYNPLTDGLQPLAVIDIWEHAYYLDYQNDRKAYINGFVESLINWEFVAQNYAAAKAAG